MHSVISRIDGLQYGARFRSEGLVGPRFVGARYRNGRLV
jgi:hypothetical protein